MRHVPRSRIQAFLLAGAVALSGCAIGVPTDPTRLLPGAQDGVSQTIPLIEGRVLDAAGRPVPDAAVRAYAPAYRLDAPASSGPVAAVSARTDADGRFVLSAPPVGSVAVEASAPSGLKALRLGVRVAQGERVPLGTLTLKPTGRIHGMVDTLESASMLGTEVFIPGTDKVARTDERGAFTLQDVPEGTYALAAMRPPYAPSVVEGIVVRPEETTETSLTLRLDAPRLETLSAASGGPGTRLTLRGANFGATKHTVLQVYFNNTLATTIERLSDTEIEVVVPDRAASGGVVVVSGGVASNSQPFSVISRIAVIPRLVGLYPGDVQQFTAVAYDERGQAIASPALEWTSSYAGAGVLSSTGRFEASGEGATRLQVTSGTVTDGTYLTTSRYELTTFAGNGTLSSFGDGLSALSGSFSSPFGLAASPDGATLYVSEADGGERVRSILPNGLLGTYAGGGSLTDDGQPLLSAKFSEPRDLAVDGAGGLAIADPIAHRIRYVSPVTQQRFGIAMQANRIYTLAGTGTIGTPQEGAMGHQSAITAPAGLAFDQSGALYFGSGTLNRVYRLDQTGLVSSIAGNGGSTPSSWTELSAQTSIGAVLALALDAAGNLAIGGKGRCYFACRSPGTYFGLAMASGSLYPLLATNSLADGPDQAELAKTRVADVRGLAFDPKGRLWIADSNHVLRRLDPSGGCVSVAGARLESSGVGTPQSGVNAGAVALSRPSAILPLSGDRILFVDGGHNRIVRLSPR
ncbi:MAG TPA: carboxypeptidase regulatory-like domain-containing protein [Pantanalinema sp.]